MPTTAPPAPAAPSLSVTQAAQRAAVHPDTIRRAIVAGHLPAARIGSRGNYRLDPADLDQLFAPRAGADAGLDGHIAALVDAAPELTPEQRDKLAGIFAAATRGGKST